MKQLIIVFLLTLILKLLVGHLISGSNVIYSFIGGYYVFLITTLILIRIIFFKKSTRVLIIPVVNILLVIIAGFLENSFMLTEENFVFIPGFFTTISEILGVLTGFLILNKIKIMKITGIILLVAMSYINFFKIESWIESWIFFTNFRTIDGKVNIKEPFWEAETLNGKINQNSYNKKTLLIDFWNTSCGICIKNFPLLDSLNNELKDDTDIAILSINIPIESDTNGMAFNIINKKQYKFNLAIGNSSLNDSFGFNTYPRVFIIKNDILVYSGNLEKAIKYLEKRN